MKDRISTYPGRVKLTPVSGQTNTYDMTLADSPTENGTPLSKATFLSDSVSEKYFAPGTDHTVSDVLDTLGSAALWDGTKFRTILNSAPIGVQVVTGYYTGNGVSGQAGDQTQTISLTFTPKLVFVMPISYNPASGSVSTALAVTGSPARSGANNILNIVTNGFQAHYIYNNPPQTNINGQIYNYIAIG